ncbi:MAG: hypothetical protein ACXVBT_11460 [Flavisolibacter sp.]
MKQLLFSLLLWLLTGTNGFASDTMVSPGVLHAFEIRFATASAVNWTKDQGWYRADFVYSDQYITAYYGSGGNLLALTKNILSPQLPLLLGQALKEKYKNYWISDLVEVSTEQGTSYYATLENGGNQLVLKSDQNDWSVSKKTRK